MGFSINLRILLAEKLTNVFEKEKTVEVWKNDWSITVTSTTKIFTPIAKENLYENVASVTDFSLLTLKCQLFFKIWIFKRRTRQTQVQTIGCSNEKRKRSLYVVVFGM